MTTIAEAAMNSGSEGVMPGITNLDQAPLLAYGGIEFSDPCRKNVPASVMFSLLWLKRS